jgi:hypothetical protein
LISYPAAECAESPCRSVDIVLPTGPGYTYLDEYDIEIHYSPKEGSGATLAGSELIKTVQMYFNFAAPYTKYSGLNYTKTIPDSDFDSELYQVSKEGYTI